MKEIGAKANSVVHMVGHAIDRISSIAKATKNGNNKKTKNITTYDEFGQKIPIIHKKPCFPYCLKKKLAILKYLILLH
jgi:hypothetical protein